MQFLESLRKNLSNKRGASYKILIFKPAVVAGLAISFAAGDLIAPADTAACENL